MLGVQDTSDGDDITAGHIFQTLVFLNYTIRLYFMHIFMKNAIEETND